MTVDEYISADKISNRVVELGKEISEDYAGKEVIVIAIMNGSFIFCADLVREIKADVIFDFMSVGSYGDSTISSENVQIFRDVKHDIYGKDCIIVEDIVDTGNTISKLFSTLSKRKPKSLKLASLLFKPARLKNEVHIDYLGFEIEDKFVIGYGLDFAGRYRELPYIGIYNENK